MPRHVGLPDERLSQREWLHPDTCPGGKLLAPSMTRSGTYIASRASLPERSATWRRLSDAGWKITSTWIDEAGAGASPNLGQLWVRIETEISGSERLILYVETEDFPLKGALIEVGMALAHGIPIRVVAPGVVLDPTSLRPLGSWVRHPLVTFCDTLDEALVGATRVTRIKDIEQTFATMPGNQLLDELVTYAASWLDQHQQDEDNFEAISRAIQARLAAVEIAQKHHSEECRFMRGDEHCSCSSSSWTWPRRGLQPATESVNP